MKRIIDGIKSILFGKMSGKDVPHEILIGDGYVIEKTHHGHSIETSAMNINDWFLHIANESEKATKI